MGGSPGRRRPTADREESGNLSPCHPHFGEAPFSEGVMLGSHPLATDQLSTSSDEIEVSYPEGSNSVHRQRCMRLLGEDLQLRCISLKWGMKSLVH